MSDLHYPSLKLCDAHYLDLRQALQKKNLWRLCSQDNFIRELRATAWLAGEAKRENFDPFIVCLLEIREKVSGILAGGRAIGCPICNAMKLMNDERVPLAWIDNVTDAVLAVAHANGLMGAHLIQSRR